MTFREMGLSSEILMGIESLGFENATPIQEKVIPYLLKNKRDLIGLAQTGTGKTAAFGLPSLEKLDINNRNPQMLVLSPTRELCLQITNDLNNYGRFIEGLHIVAVYGGADISRQIKALKDGAHIIVATPGRIHDLVRRQRVNLSEVNTLVLDEADEMLKMGFREDVDAILAKTPAEKNTLLFSATMSPEILGITKNYMTDPLEITIGQKNSGAENVSHIYHMVHSKDRYEALKRVVDNYPDMYAIVFCRTRQEAKDVAASLMRDGYNADALHGDLSQSQRDFVMQKFREKTLSVLVGTDVAARGLDVNNLTHVINYNLPDDLEVYTHRSGRTGRAGKEGIAISIINMKERGHIAQIEKTIHKKIAYMPVPTGKEICERRLFDMIEHMQQITVDHGQIDLYIDKAYEMLSDISKEEIIKRFVYVEFSRFLDYYKNSPDLNNEHRESHGAENRSSGKGRNKGKSMSRIVLNIGKGKNITKKEIINLVASTPSSRNVEIGLIEIYKKASSVEVETKMSKAIVSELNEKKYKGIEIKAEENYEFTGVSQDDRDWEPRHKKSFRSAEKNGRPSFSKEKRGDKSNFKGKGSSHYPKTREKRDRGQGGRR
ncbi:MAG TPA: DEAD/DEAH box helicase [Bacteroidales bacterium]|nr:DEAD/DEAH box helicase [Bacteroidales bacterium]